MLFVTLMNQEEHSSACVSMVLGQVSVPHPIDEHVIGNNGLRMADDKLRAIIDAPSPTNVQELRSLLGLLNYNRIRPLNKLLCTKTPWGWSKECQDAFQYAKEALISSEARAPSPLERSFVQA